MAIAIQNVVFRTSPKRPEEIIKYWFRVLPNTGRPGSHSGEFVNFASGFICLPPVVVDWIRHSI